MAAAKKGVDVAGNARKDAERKIGRSISINDNYLVDIEKRKRLGITTSFMYKSIYNSAMDVVYLLQNLNTINLSVPVYIQTFYNTCPVVFAVVVLKD